VGVHCETSNEHLNVKCGELSNFLFLNLVKRTLTIRLFEMMLYRVLTAIRLTAGGSSTVHIHILTIHRTTQLTTLVARLSGIRTQNDQTKINEELTA
jgi:hypothetical protein